MSTGLLLTWLKKHAPGVTLRVGPSAASDGDAISVDLVGLDRTDTHLQSQRDAMRIQRLRLTYRVTADFADPLQAHQMLCDLVFAAMDDPLPDPGATPLELLPTSLAHERFGAMPGVALYLEMIVARARKDRDAPPVREVPILRAAHALPSDLAANRPR